jgi:hypothetical protein
MTEVRDQNDVARAHVALDAKALRYTMLWQYYDGVQPLVYSTERLRSIFQSINVRFSENWCGAVVNAATDRLNLTGFAVSGDDDATEYLAGLFEDANLGLESDDVHLAMLVCGEAFVIAWKEDAGEVDAYYNDPRLVHVQYDADNPRRMAWAAKRWVADDDTYRLTMYYPDHIEYYYTTAKAENVTDAQAYMPAEIPSAANPYGKIPVFHFRRATRATRSELGDVIPLQDAVNKLFADMMVAAEFGAFRQRFVISDSDVSQLKNAPNELWNIPAGSGEGQGTSVGEFAQTDLGMYLSAMDRLAVTIAVITRTPKHYMLAQGGDPSGEALITMEAPLTRKVERYRERASATWKQVAAFMSLLAGRPIEAEDVTPVFDPIETTQPFTAAQTGVLKNQLGVSHKQLQRELGYTDSQIEQIATERAEQGAALGAQLLGAFDHGDDTDGEDGLE